MHTRRLGTQGLECSALAQGCMGLTAFYGHDTAAADPTAVVHAAVERGITLFDTADAYGPFTNEEAVGRAIAGIRDRVLVSTKFGVVRAADGTDLGLDGSPAHVRKAVVASLRRLGTDHIDLYILHRVDPAVPVEETVGAMAELVAAGTVRFIGLSEVSGDQVRRAHAVHPLSVVQSEYSLWSREIEDGVGPVLAELGIGLLAYSPLGRGLLSGRIRREDDLAPDDWRRTNPRFQGENLARNLALVDRVRRLAADRGATPAQLALAWLLHRGPHVVPLQGATTVEQLDENVAAADMVLTEAELAEIERATPRDAPAGARAPAAYLEQIEKGG
ncbi:aldo/keto reductase [Pseudonocardia thermophila]|uniref:aldo/keto reductase n=1 Tax=Pseudonocardia thermophila TaxID=1848 RepID=UPI00248D5873|nr:aldo/keto reductase [Pseudonocardia thermophila]